MKKTSLLICFVMLSLFLAAQETVTLKFTSTTPNGSYYPFDVVNVTNVTRGWTESLVYPDTTMILTSYNALQENIYQDGFISEVYPNPLSGTAYVYFEMWKSGLLNAKVLSINGSVLSEFTEYMDEGVHQIIINMSIPQMAFLVLRTNDNQYIKKIINIDSGTSDNISINKVSDIKRDPRTRDGGEFVVGDVMSYVAISFYGGNVIESQRITKAQYNNELFSLLFNVNINPTIPTITTSVVTNITHNSAIAGGNVVNNGGAIVTERGVCWGTSPNPTASGNHVVASSVGNGSFVCNVTGLLPTTTYYLRAYAINSVGPSYGNEECFTTIIEPPLIVMDSISNITTTSATLYASVLDDGGALVSPRGFCWSTSPNPVLFHSIIT